MDDRCRHRSASLSCGWAEQNGVRCAYHGWLYDKNGRCVEVPSMPDTAIPKRAKLYSYDVAVRYDLIWVRLDSSLDTKIPTLRSWGNLSRRCVQGRPYEWATSGHRRLENFFDLAHFAFVHDGSLGTRDDPSVPIPIIEQSNSELRWQYFPEKRRQN